MTESPYLTAVEAMEYLRLRSKQALYNHIQRNRLPVCRMGGVLRFDRRELDAWLRGTNTVELRRQRGAA